MIRHRLLDQAHARAAEFLLELHAAGVSPGPRIEHLHVVVLGDEPVGRWAWVSSRHAFGSRPDPLAQDDRIEASGRSRAPAGPDRRGRSRRRPFVDGGTRDAENRRDVSRGEEGRDFDCGGGAGAGTCDAAEPVHPGRAYHDCRPARQLTLTDAPRSTGRSAGGRHVASPGTICATSASVASGPA